MCVYHCNRSDRLRSNSQHALGAVDLWCMFLQQFVAYLYKAERVWCSYSTWMSDNAVEMRDKHCPKGSTQSLLLFVAGFWLRPTRPATRRRDQNALDLNKIHTPKINDEMVSSLLTASQCAKLGIEPFKLTRRGDRNEYYNYWFRFSKECESRSVL